MVVPYLYPNRLLKENFGNTPPNRLPVSPVFTLASASAACANGLLSTHYGRSYLTAMLSIYFAASVLTFLLGVFFLFLLTHHDCAILPEAFQILYVLPAEQRGPFLLGFHGSE